MNILDSIETEITLIQQEVNKDLPNLLEILMECSESAKTFKSISNKNQEEECELKNFLNQKIQPFIQMIQRITQTKNYKIVNAILIIVQKFQTAQILKKEDIPPIIYFIHNYKDQISDEPTQIKMISTTLHLISTNTISTDDHHFLFQLLSLLISYYPDKNNILCNSSIQGVFSLFSIYEEGCQHPSEKQIETTSLLLDAFFQIQNDSKIEELNFPLNAKTKAFCDDILQMLLKNSRNLLRKSDKLQSMVFHKISICLTTQFAKLDNQSKIRRIRLVFNFIIAVEDKVDLLIQMKSFYLDQNQPLIVKLIINDGLIQLFQNQAIILKLHLQKIMQNEIIVTILEYLLKMIFDGINQFEKIQDSTPIANGNINKILTLKLIETPLFGQIDQFLSSIQLPSELLITQIVKSINMLSISISQFSDNIKSFKGVIEKEAILSINQELKGSSLPIIQLPARKTSSQQIELSRMSGQEDDEEFSPTFQQMNLESPIEPEQKFYRRMIDQIWKPIIQVQKQLLKIKKLNEKQYHLLIDTNITWINLTAAKKHLKSFEQFVRILAVQTSPQNNQYSESDRWVQSFDHLINIIMEFKDYLTPKTWNFIFQSFQRIEFVMGKQGIGMQEKIFSINQLFLESQNYSVKGCKFLNQNETLIHILDALNQLTLQAIEKIQLNDKNYKVDSIFKQFGQERLVQVVIINWSRVYIFWEMVEAHMICVAGSRIPEMRLLAITNIKEIILSGFRYFSDEAFSLGNVGSFDMSEDESDNKGFSIQLKLITQSCDTKPKLTPFQYMRNSKCVLWRKDWSQFLMSPLKEMMQINYDEIGENAVSIVYELLKSRTIHPEQMGRFIEVLDEFMKCEQQKNWKDQDKQQKNSRKNFYYRLFLAVNCLHEIMNHHHLISLSGSNVKIVKQLLEFFKAEVGNNREAYFKVVCMIWKLAEIIINNYGTIDIDEETLTNIWEVLFLTTREACQDFQEESRFAGIQSLTQLIKSVFEQNKSQEKKLKLLSMLELFYECANQILSQYMKYEHNQIQLMLQTPRFNTVPETPKFQIQSLNILNQIRTKEEFKSQHISVLLKFQEDTLKHLFSKMSELYMYLLKEDFEFDFRFVMEFFSQVVLIHSYDNRYEFLLKFKDIFIAWISKSEEERQLEALQIMGYLEEMIKQPNEECRDILLIIDKILPLLYKYFHFLVTKTKYYSNEKVLDKALSFYKLILSYPNKYEQMNLKLSSCDQDYEMFGYLSELQQNFEELPNAAQKRWLMFIADSLEGINLSAYHDKLIEALATSFYILIKNKLEEINQFTPEIKQYIQRITKLILKCQISEREERNDQLQLLLTERLQRTLLSCIHQISKESFKEIICVFLDPDKETIEQRSHELEEDGEKVCSKTKYSRQTAFQLLTLQRDYAWIDFLYNDVSLVLENEQDKLNIIVELISCYFSGCCVNLQCQFDCNILNREKQALVVQQNLVLHFCHMMKNGNEEGLSRGLKENLRGRLLESSEQMLKLFVQVEQEGGLKQYWSECLFNTLKLLDWLSELQDCEVEVNRCYPIFVEMVMTNEPEVKSRLRKVFARFEQYIPIKND